MNSEFLLMCSDTYGPPYYRARSAMGRRLVREFNHFWYIFPGSIVVQGIVLTLTPLDGPGLFVAFLLVERICARIVRRELRSMKLSTKK